MIYHRLRQRDHCFKSGDIPKTEGVQNVKKSLYLLCDLHDIQLTPKKTLCWSENILQEACPCLPANTVTGRHVAFHNFYELWYKI